MTKPRIILTLPWSEDVMTALEADYDVGFLDNENFEVSMNGAEAFCPQVFEPVDQALINALPPSVKIVASFGVGVDHIDLNAAKEKGLVVTNTPDVLSDDTADLAIFLMISAMRGLYKSEKILRQGGWDGSDDPEMLGRKIGGKTLGLVGMGRIGQIVARRAKAFDMNIIYFSRTRKPELEKELSLTFVPTLEALVESADVVSLHTSMHAGTHHIISKEILQKFKPGSFLVNTGRGSLVDEKALVQVLKNGPLAGAGLDVYELEPEMTEGLQDLDNVTLLPHLGSATIETRSAMGFRVKENLDCFFATGKGQDIIF